MERRDLYSVGSLMPFPELSDTYDIPNTHFLTYTADRTVLTKQWASTPLEAPISQILYAILMQDTERRAITMLYSAMLTEQLPTLASLRE